MEDQPQLSTKYEGTWCPQETVYCGCFSLYRNLTSRGPCIMIYSYNRSQQGALFLYFILIKNSTCFGHTFCPSSAVLILYSQQMVFVILVMLTVC